MRWIKKKKTLPVSKISLPRDGDYRYRTAFLWKPKTLSNNGVLETRWLERAWWREQFDIESYYKGFGGWLGACWWDDIWQPTFEQENCRSFHNDDSTGSFIPGGVPLPPPCQSAHEKSNFEKKSSKPTFPPSFNDVAPNG